MSRWYLPAALAVSLLVLLPGCNKQTEEISVAETPEPASKRQTRVVVPEEVQGKWKAVRIAVTDKATNQEQVYTLDLGHEITLSGSAISVQAQNFLPAFIMKGTNLTSVSNEPRNPAVQIIVREGGEEIFIGWLFSLYPGTHAFQHPRYSFTLVGYIPAKNG